MIIVLKPNTTEKNITRVENLVKNRGLDTHLVRGTEMTIIGCIGDTTLIDPRLSRLTNPLIKSCMSRSLTSLPTELFIRKIRSLMFPVFRSVAITWD